MPASLLSHATTMPEKRRAPSVAMVSLSGCALASAISSGSDFAGTSGCASRKNETSATRAIGTKSFIGSYGNDLNVYGSVTNAAAVAKKNV